MFWRKKPKEPEGEPLGVSLNALLALLQPTSIKARLEGQVLIADHGKYTTRVEAVPPHPRAGGPDPIRAVVRVQTTLPAELSAQGKLSSSAGAAMLNSFASLGAVTAPGGRLVVGSRLAIYQGEEGAWDSLHLPLLLFTVISASEAILGGFRRVFSQQVPSSGASRWTDADLGLALRQLSQICACSGGRGGLTAEFGLEDGAHTAAAGHRATALFQMSLEEPHPELGGGLFCVMHMPHTISNRAHLEHVCEQLNMREMDAFDQPPHFGAWCPGRMGNGPAYVSFLPNALHRVSGIASNVAVWALHRAQWANEALAALGVKL